MPYILSLETSSTVCSVALHKSGILVGSSELHLEKSHSSYITVLAEELLRYAGIGLKEVAAVAISGGPGSYTGLRIGTSTAKGLCFGLDIPLIEVSTLEALALAQIQKTPEPERFLYCPMLDARRMEVYCGVYRGNLEVIQAVTPVVLTADSFADLLQQPVLFFGSGAAKFRPLVQHQATAFFIESASPDARAVGELAWQRYQQQQFEDVAYYEPFYLKEFYTTAKLPGA